MGFLAAVAAGVIPMLIYPLFLYWMDRYEKEPLGLLAAVFLWGFFPAAILSLISQLVLDVPLLLLDSSGSLADLISIIVVAPITEEFFKGLAVLAVFLLWRNEFDGVFDGIIYGGLVGFGFAAVENILYLLEGDTALFLLRAVVFGLNHAFFTSLTGIGLGVARHSPKLLTRLIAPLAGLLIAMAAHAFHNASTVFSAEMPEVLCLALIADWGGVLFVFVTMILAIRRERQWIISELCDEVSLKTLNEEQYGVVCSPMRRFSTRLEALFAGGPVRWWRVGRYYHLLTELAYKKHAHRKRGETGAKLALIESLRARAARASAELNSAS